MPRVITQSPVKYQICNETYELTGSSDAPPVEPITFKVAWQDRLAFVIFAFGWSGASSANPAAASSASSGDGSGDGSGSAQAVSTTSGSSTTFTRAPRLSSPYTPGLLAISYKIQGKGKEPPISPSRPFSHALIEIVFGSLPYGTEGTGAYLEISYKGSANLRTRPNVSSKFSNGEVIDFDSGVWVGQTAIQLSFHQVANWPALKASFEAVKGMVNSDQVTIDGTNYAAGYLLIPTYEMSESIAIMGSPQYEAGLAILAASIPWNSGVRSDGTVDTITPPPYQTAAFAGLFQ